MINRILYNLNMGSCVREVLQGVTWFVMNQFWCDRRIVKDRDMEF